MQQKVSTDYIALCFHTNSSDFIFERKRNMLSNASATIELECFQQMVLLRCFDYYVCSKNNQ